MGEGDSLGDAAGGSHPIVTRCTALPLRQLGRGGGQGAVLRTIAASASRQPATASSASSLPLPGALLRPLPGPVRPSAGR